MFCLRNKKKNSAFIQQPDYSTLTSFQLFTGMDITLPRRYSPLDTAALEEVSLHHTRAETDYDMGTVNF